MQVAAERFYPQAANPQSLELHGSADFHTHLAPFCLSRLWYSVPKSPSTLVANHHQPGKICNPLAETIIMAIMHFLTSEG